MGEVKRSNRGRAQAPARMTGGQEHEIGYEAKKTGASAAQVKRALGSEGNGRTKVERPLRK